MLNFQFAHYCRLADNNRVRELYRLGKKISSSFTSIYFYPNAKTHPRLCLSIGKRQVAKAVARNAVKRRIRESFRLHHVHLPAVDIVVVVYKSYVNFTPAQQREILDYQWQRLAQSLPALRLA